MHPEIYRIMDEKTSNYISSISNRNPHPENNKKENVKNKQKKIGRKSDVNSSLPYIIFYDIPLLYETGKEKEFDKIVVISADEDKIIKRLFKKKISTEEFKKRVKEQIPLTKKEKNADFVIRNNGTVKDLTDKVDYLIKDIPGICTE